MNLYKLIADFLHLLSFLILIYKLIHDKSAKGISCKTQEIYLIVFLTRYLDLLIYTISLYNTIMKILFITVTIIIIYFIRFNKRISPTYNREKEDNFPHVNLIPFALIMSLIINSKFDYWEIIWSFSLWLESVAILPQINILLQKNGVEKFTSHYIASLGAYRFFYLLSWIHSYYFENYISFVSVFSGILQVILYADFFYVYLKIIKQKFTSDLPLKNIETEKQNLKS